MNAHLDLSMRCGYCYEGPRRGKTDTVAMLTYVVIAVTHHSKNVYTHND